MVVEILIIGGSKFIGKHLVLKLAKKSKVNITVVNRGISNPYFKYPSNVNHLRADRKKFEELKEVIGDKIFDYVFDIVLVYGDDAKSIIKLLSGKVKKRFVYVSSASVYEGAGNISTIKSLPIFEDDKIGPTTDDQHWYLKEKRLCEQYLLEAFEKDKFPVSIVRPSFVYGPDNYIYREAYFFERILKDEPVLLPAKSNEIISDFVFVDDVVNICIACMDNEKALGQAYNATSGEMVTPLDFTRLVAKIMNKDPEIYYYSRDDLKAVNWPENHIPPYPFTDEGKFCLSLIKSSNHLKFHPIHRLKDGLKETYDWYKNQTDLEFQRPDPEKMNQLREFLQSKK